MGRLAQNGSREWSSNSVGDLTLPTNTTTTGRLQAGLTLLGLVLISTLGCGHDRYSCQDSFTHRVLAPVNLDLREELPPAKKSGQDASGKVQAHLGHPQSSREVDSETANAPVAAQGSMACAEPAQILTLAEAIDTAFRQQPRLRVYLESVEQARRGQDLAFAPFLPIALAGYSVGGFDVNAGGLSVIPGFLPASRLFPPSERYPSG